MSIQERVQMILKMHNLSSAAFADKIGVQRSSVSHVISGRNKPGLDFLEKILLHFPRVNAHWLITGKALNEQPETIVNKESKGNISSNEVKSTIKLIENVKDGEPVKIVLFYADGTFKQYSNAE